MHRARRIAIQVGLSVAADRRGPVAGEPAQARGRRRPRSRAGWFLARARGQPGRRARDDRALARAARRPRPPRARVRLAARDDARLAAARAGAADGRRRRRGARRSTSPGAPARGPRRSRPCSWTRSSGTGALVVLAAAGAAAGGGGHRRDDGARDRARASALVCAVSLAILFSRRARRGLRPLRPLARKLRIEAPTRALYDALHAYRDHPRRARLGLRARDRRAAPARDRRRRCWRTGWGSRRLRHAAPALPGAVPRDDRPDLAERRRAARGDVRRRARGRRRRRARTRSCSGSRSSRSAC